MQIYLRMNRNNIKHFKQYKQLRTEIDNLSSELENQHAKQMQCKKGCDKCCINYNIFPIEFYSILSDFKDNKLLPEISFNPKENVCIFLNNSVCTIYHHRPIICRTHGLPLLFMNENSEWELSACDLNFTEFNFGEFTMDNTFPQDKYNSKLFMLNKMFISEFQEKKYDEFDLIPLKNLVEQLQ